MDALPRASTGLIFSVNYIRHGEVRSLPIGRTAFLTTVAILVLMTGWALAAGLYVCFHDELLASLMTRQADMQYGYEDQIAVLRTDLGRETSRNLLDRHTIDTALHDLAARAAKLEGHAAAIDRLVGETAPDLEAIHPSTASLARARARVRPTPSNARRTDDGGQIGPIPDPGPTGLRLDADHAGLAIDTLNAHLAQAEADQSDTIAHLRDPLVRDAHRLATALAGAGIMKHMRSGVGGPFVPLADAGHGTFDDQIALVSEAIEKRNELAAVVDRVPLRRPLAGPIEVSSVFGARLDPFLGRPAMHTGIDLRDNGDDAVRATAAGVVTVAGSSGGYGDMVEVDHGDGLVTRYAHLSAIDVVPHQRVAAGSVVGRVGSTGRATGPHLHYETRIDGEPVDPARFLNAGLALARD